MAQTATQTHRHGTQSPIDDSTYDLMQALVSKLEGIEAYQMYREDADSQTGQIFDDLLRDDRQHAERLLATLRDKLR